MILSKTLCHATHTQALGALVPLMRARTQIMAKTDILTTLCSQNPILAQCSWHENPASLFTLLARWRRRWRREIGKHCCILMTICMLGLSLLALGFLFLFPGCESPCPVTWAVAKELLLPVLGRGMSIHMTALESRTFGKGISKNNSPFGPGARPPRAPLDQLRPTGQGSPAQNLAKALFATLEKAN